VANAYRLYLYCIFFPLVCTTSHTKAHHCKGVMKKKNEIKKIHSLQYLSIKSLRYQYWQGLPLHSQKCLYPYFLPIRRLQRQILARRRRRMSAIDNLLLQQMGLDLRPSNSIVLTESHAHLHIVEGDHLAVVIIGSGGVYHHGIYLGVRDGIPKVADFSSPTGDKKMRDGRLRIVDYTDFVRDKGLVYVVPYEKDSPEKLDADNRRNAVELAILMVNDPNPDFHKYNLMSWNCECFALMCKTGQYQMSEQIQKMFEFINNDIHSQNSKLAAVMRRLQLVFRRASIFFLSHCLKKCHRSRPVLNMNRS
jgi:hypothetical protein